MIHHHKVSEPRPCVRAIDESESEWSTHDAKKCISTARGVGAS